MPRSNKKKSAFKPPPKHPTSQQFMSSQDDISFLLTQEKNEMISRAIASGLKHGIKLKHGSSNPGLGDCAFESVIQNNNDRFCFSEKYRMSVNYYRQIWATDIANRTANSDWNIYSSQQQWLAGWQQMLVPGTYERGIFGDLMLSGIACGIKKTLLIFNTNLQSPHDPIYVVDPRKFSVEADNEIPIVLAYNLSHYESMQPCTETDIQATINLVIEYIENRYRFDRKDLPFLLAIDKNVPKISQDPSVSKKTFNFEDTAKIKSREVIKANKEQKENENNVSKIYTGDPTKQTLNQSKMSNFRKRKGSFEDQKIEEDHPIEGKKMQINKNSANVKVTDKKELQHNFKELDQEDQGKEKSFTATICYKLKNKASTQFIKELSGKFECPICKDKVKNVQLHLKRKERCGHKIDLEHFTTNHVEFMNKKRNYQNRINNQKAKQKAKNMNPMSFNEINKEAARKSKAKSKFEDKESFDDKKQEGCKKIKIKSKE